MPRLLLCAALGLTLSTANASVSLPTEPASHRRPISTFAEDPEPTTVPAPPSPILTAADEPAQDGTVLFVGDGDTLTIRVGDAPRGTIVRLYGIDCPELHQPRGLEARDFTKAFTAGGAVQVVVTEREKYGRLVALVLLPDGRCLNEELVRAGWAWYFHNPRFVTLASESRTGLLSRIGRHMAQAREARIGLWADEKPVNPSTWRRRKENQKTHGAVKTPAKKDKAPKTTKPPRKGGRRR